MITFLSWDALTTNVCSNRRLILQETSRTQSVWPSRRFSSTQFAPSPFSLRKHPSYITTTTSSTCVYWYSLSLIIVQSRAASDSKSQSDFNRAAKSFEFCLNLLRPVFSRFQSHSTIWQIHLCSIRSENLKTKRSRQRIAELSFRKLKNGFSTRLLSSQFHSFDFDRRIDSCAADWRLKLFLQSRKFYRMIKLNTRMLIEISKILIDILFDPDFFTTSARCEPKVGVGKSRFRCTDSFCEYSMIRLTKESFCARFPIDQRIKSKSFCTLLLLHPSINNNKQNQPDLSIRFRENGVSLRSCGPNHRNFYSTSRFWRSYRNLRLPNAPWRFLHVFQLQAWKTDHPS